MRERLCCSDARICVAPPLEAAVVALSASSMLAPVASLRCPSFLSEGDGSDESEVDEADKELFLKRLRVC